MSPIQVPEIDPEVDPLFVLAQRDPKRRRRLIGFELVLHEDIFEDVRSIAQEALERLQQLEEREYEPTAELEQGEQCFSMRLDDLPTPQHEEPEGETLQGIADLLVIISDPTALEAVSAAELSSDKYLAYGIVLTDMNGRRIGFLRQEDPARPVRRGRVFGRFTDSLQKLDERPTLILYPDIDLIITPDRVFALRKAAFSRLLADVDIALAEVDQSVHEVTSQLGPHMHVSAGVVDVLRGVARRRPSFALRLRRLGNRAKQLSDAGVTNQQIRGAIIEVDGRPHELLNDQDEFEFAEDAVGAFLDVLEGRWFKDSLGGEPRRADRYSRRT